jgi:uncharacterized protein YkwD
MSQKYSLIKLSYLDPLVLTADKFNFISHTGSNGSDLRKRLKRAGYKPCYGAENLALATKSWPDTVEKWMESSGHKTNILDKRAASVGFWQVDKRYWVMVVGKKC